MSIFELVLVCCALGGADVGMRQVACASRAQDWRMCLVASVLLGVSPWLLEISNETGSLNLKATPARQSATARANASAP